MQEGGKQLLLGVRSARFSAVSLVGSVVGSGQGSDVVEQYFVGDRLLDTAQDVLHHREGIRMTFVRAHSHELPLAFNEVEEAFHYLVVAGHQLACQLDFGNR